MDTFASNLILYLALVAAFTVNSNIMKHSFSSSTEVNHNGLTRLSYSKGSSKCNSIPYWRTKSSLAVLQYSKM